MFSRNLLCFTTFSTDGHDSPGTGTKPISKIVKNAFSRHYTPTVFRWTFPRNLRGKVFECRRFGGRRFRVFTRCPRFFSFERVCCGPTGPFKTDSGAKFTTVRFKTSYRTRIDYKRRCSRPTFPKQFAIRARREQNTNITTYSRGGGGGGGCGGVMIIS